MEYGLMVKGSEYFIEQYELVHDESGKIIGDKVYGVVSVPKTLYDKLMNINWRYDETDRIGREYARYATL